MSTINDAISNIINNGGNNASSEEGEMTNYNNGYDNNGKILARRTLADGFFNGDFDGDAASGVFVAGASTTVGKYTCVKTEIDGESYEVMILTSSLPEGYGKGVSVTFEDGVKYCRVVRRKSGEHDSQPVILVDRLTIVEEEPVVHTLSESTDAAVADADAALVADADEIAVSDADEMVAADASAPQERPKKKNRRGKRRGRRNRGKRGGNADGANASDKPANASKSKSRKRPTAYELVKNAYIERRADVAAMGMKGIVEAVFADKDDNTVMRMKTGSFNSSDTMVDITARDEEQAKLMRALKPDDFVTAIPNPFTPPSRSADISNGEFPAFDIERGLSLKLEKGANEFEDGENQPHLPAPNVFFDTVVSANGLARDAFGQQVVPASAAERQELLRYVGKRVVISGLLDVHNPTDRSGVFVIHKVKVDDKYLVAKGSWGKQAGVRRGGGFVARAGQRAA